MCALRATIELIGALGPLPPVWEPLIAFRGPRFRPGSALAANRHLWGEICVCLSNRENKFFMNIVLHVSVLVYIVRYIVMTSIT